MGKNNDDISRERDTMTLDLDDGSTLECIVLNMFSVGERDYIALLPLNKDGGVDENAQIFLYRMNTDEDENVILDNIEDDEEFEMASDYFDEILDEEEFESLFE